MSFNRALLTKISLLIIPVVIFGLVLKFAVPSKAGGPAGIVKFFFIDRQDYAASGSIIVLRNNADGTQTNMSSEMYLAGHVPQGHLLFDKLTPDCSGNLKIYLGALDYEIRWVHENNSFPSARVITTDFFENDLSTRVDLRYESQNPQHEFNASLLVEGFDENFDGTVSDTELAQSRYWFSTSCGEGPVAYYGPTPSPTSTPVPTATMTPSPTNTPTPTATPTPTPALVPFEQIGLKHIGGVELTVQQGITSYTFAGIAESITATQFGNYGYPTSFGPGISMNPSTAGISPGSKINLTLYVNSNVPLGTYSGYQLVRTNVVGLLSEYPVTVHVVASAPTPTPTATMTPTPTPVPVLALSNIQAVNITKSSAQITWSTNVLATSQVSYGASTRSMIQTPENAVLKTSHSISLTGLSGGKTYSYYVISKDQNGVSKVSAILKFTTPRK